MTCECSEAELELALYAYKAKVMRACEETGKKEMAPVETRADKFPNKI